MPVVTELVIDGAGATKGAQEYARAMDRAQEAQQRSLGAMNTNLRAANDNVSSLTDGIGKLQAAIVSSAAVVYIFKTIGEAIYAVYTSIKDSNKALVEMELSAKRAGLTLAQFNSLRSLATESGVSKENFATGAEAMAKNLNDARRTENDLSRLLDANNVKFKKGNDLLIDTNRLFDIARDLIRRAGTEQDKIKIAEMLGLTKEWVPALDKTKEKFNEIQAGAAALGVVITSETIELAKKFEKEWNDAGNVFSVWIKAKVVELLPWLDSLIKKAKEVVDEVEKAAAKRAGPDFRVTPESNTTREAKENLDNLSLAVSALKGAWNELFKDRQNSQTFELLAQAFRLWTNQADEATKALIRQRDALDSNNAAWDDWKDSINASIKAARDAGWKDFVKDIDAMLDATSKRLLEGGESKIPGARDKRDFWDRAVESIDKHIARVRADTIAIGLSVGEHEALRAEFALLEAAKMVDKNVTDEQIKKYTELRATMSSLEALDKSGIALNAEKRAEFKRTTQAIGEVTQRLADLKQFQDIATGALSGFAKDIAHGVEPMTALVNQAKRLGDIFIDMAAKKIVNAAMGSLFGGVADTAAPTAGASSAAAILTTAGTTLAAQMVAGATEAAAVLGVSVPAAAATLPVAGAATGTEVAVGGVAAGSALAAGGAAAGTALWGPIAILAAAAAAIGFGLFSGGADKKKQAAVKAAEAAVAGGERRQGFEFDRRLAGLDTSTQAGALEAFEIEAQRQRIQEAEAGGQAMAMLEQKLALDRENIIKDFAKKAADAEADAAKQRMEQIADFDRSMNDLRGKGFLNDAIDLLDKFNAFKSAGIGGAALGDFLSLGLQKIVDGADLAGSAFQDLLTLFPDMAGAVHESTKAIEEQIEAQRQFQKSIEDYLARLRGGPDSPLNPQARLAQTASDFQRQIGLAQGGDVGARSSITQYSDAYINAARDFYASAGPFRSIFDQVTSALTALVGGTAGGATGMTGGVMPIAGPVSFNNALVGSGGTANDNRQNFSYLASVNASGFNAVVSKLDDVIARIDASATTISDTYRNEAPRRPGRRTAA